MITKRQLENVFIKYVNDQQSATTSPVRAFAICLDCGFPLYRTDILRDAQYVEMVFHFNYDLSSCDNPRWRKQ